MELSDRSNEFHVKLEPDHVRTQLKPDHNFLDDLNNLLDEALGMTQNNIPDNENQQGTEENHTAKNEEEEIADEGRYSNVKQEFSMSGDDLKYLHEEIEIKEHEINIQNEVLGNRRSNILYQNGEIIQECHVKLVRLPDNLSLNSNKEKSFICKICKFRASKMGIFKRHIQAVHAKFAQKQYLKNHEKCHSDEKPFACIICQFRTRSKYWLRKHMVSHTGKKLIACDKCHYRTIDNSRLTKHKKKHSKEKFYLCNASEKKITGKCNHIGEKPVNPTDENPLILNAEALFNHTGGKPINYNGETRDNHTNEKPVLVKNMGPNKCSNFCSNLCSNLCNVNFC